MSTATIANLGKQAALQTVTREKRASVPGAALKQMDGMLNKVPGLAGRSPAMQRTAAGLAGAGTAGLAGAGGAMLLGGGGGGGGQPPAAAPQPGAGAGPGADPGAAAGGGAGSKINLGTFHMQNAPVMQDITDNAGRAAEWVKGNPGKAALLGLGGAGVGYGLYSLLGRKKQDKEASDRRPRTKKEFFKRAAEVVRHNSVVILNRYLDKIACDAPAHHQRGLRSIQASLISGATLNRAISQAYPRLGPQERIKVAKDMTKRAMQDFDDDLGSESSGASFTGTPNEGTSWMRANS